MCDDWKNRFLNGYVPIDEDFQKDLSISKDIYDFKTKRMMKVCPFISRLGFTFKPSRAENILFEQLCKLKLNPVQQYEISKYTLDIAFPKLKLDIEVDGLYHELPTQTLKDKKRDDFLSSKGWKIIRFTYDDVIKHKIKIANKIKKEVIK